MKRTNLVTKIVSILLFAAMAAYMGVYLFRSLSRDIRTAPAVCISVEESTLMTGIIVRDEQCIESGEEYLSICAENGKMLAMGDTIAVAYESEEALKRAGRIHELELEKQYILSALSDGSSDNSAAKKDSSIKSAVTQLAAAAARHETDTLYSATINLSALVLDKNGINATEADLTAIQDELSSLKQTAARDTKTIAASESGLFCSSADGYEHIGHEDLANLTPDRLKSLSAKPRDISRSVCGKLVSSSAWYYAATIKEEDAGRLTVGGLKDLSFGRYYSAPLSAVVVSISPPSDGECAIVFRCTMAMAEMLTVRFADAEIVYDSSEGLRVPKEACYVDDGGTYVYTATGIRAEKIYIDIIKDMDSYYLAYISSEEKSLRENSSIILTSREIYDGMLLE